MTTVSPFFLTNNFGRLKNISGLHYFISYIPYFETTQQFPEILLFAHTHTHAGSLKVCALAPPCYFKLANISSMIHSVESCPRPLMTCEKQMRWPEISLKLPLWLRSVWSPVSVKRAEHGSPHPSHRWADHFWPILRDLFLGSFSISGVIITGAQIVWSVTVVFVIIAQVCL